MSSSNNTALKVLGVCASDVTKAKMNATIAVNYQTIIANAQNNKNVLENTSPCQATMADVSNNCGFLNCITQYPTFEEKNSVESGFVALKVVKPSRYRSTVPPVVCENMPSFQEQQLDEWWDN